MTLQPEYTSVYAQYNCSRSKSELVQAKLQASGVPTAVHYPSLVNAQPAYKALSAGGDTPISNWMAKHVMSLPMGPDISSGDMASVIDSLFGVN